MGCCYSVRGVLWQGDAARGGEEGQGPRGRGMVCRGDDADLDACYAEEGLASCDLASGLLVSGDPRMGAGNSPATSDRTG